MNANTKTVQCYHAPSVTVLVFENDGVLCLSNEIIIEEDGSGSWEESNH